MISRCLNSSLHRTTRLRKIILRRKSLYIEPKVLDLPAADQLMASHPGTTTTPPKFQQTADRAQLTSTFHIVHYFCLFNGLPLQISNVNMILPPLRAKPRLINTAPSKLAEVHLFVSPRVGVSDSAMAVTRSSDNSSFIVGDSSMLVSSIQIQIQNREMRLMLENLDRHVFGTEFPTLQHISHIFGY